MRIEVLDGEIGWPLIEALDREVYSPEVMATVPWRDVTWAHADKRILIHSDVGVCCHVGVFWRVGTLNGEAARIGGVGGVMTSAKDRRRGHAGAGMRRAAELMVEHNSDFGLLFCEPHNERYYQGLGWTIFAGEVWTEQPLGHVRFDIMHAMTLALRKAPRGGVIDLCGLPW